MLNPLTYTEKIIRSFLRYQLTAYPFADERLNDQMRRLLSLDHTRSTPLLKGPYVSLSRAFRIGATIEKLIQEKVLHEHMRQIVPFPMLYGHQEEGIRAIHKRHTTLISTGTGSGKSECFLYPIISRCLELRDQDGAPGICAVLVYPMNALAEDQLGRLRELLAGSGITFGMYVGKTPEKESDVVGVRLGESASREDYRRELEAVRLSGEGIAVRPFEELCSREIMRGPGHQPRVLLTNAKQLELLLTRRKDVELFDNALLEFLVFDEAHTFSGAEGAEAACLLRRLRSFCGRNPDQTACVATSATIVDPANPDAAREFASRFFGVAQDAVVTVNESYEAELWSSARSLPAAPSKALEEIRQAVDVVDDGAAVRAAWKKFTGQTLPAGDWETGLFDTLAANELLYQTAAVLKEPKSLADLISILAETIGRPIAEEEIIAWLILGAAARRDGRPLIRPVVHGFIRGVPGAVVTFAEDSSGPTLHLSAEDDDDGGERRMRLPVSTCTTCGQHYFEHCLADFDFTGATPGGGKASGDEVYWPPVEQVRDGVRLLSTDRLISQEDEEDATDSHLPSLYFCRACGAAHNKPGTRCLACGQGGQRLGLQITPQKKERVGHLTTCACCGSHGRSYAGRFREPAKPVRAVNVADVHVLAQDMVHHAERKRLLVFADNRQDAAFQAGWMRDHARRFRLRALMAREIANGPISIGDLGHKLDRLMEEDDNLSSALLPEVWQIAPDKTTNEHRNQRHYLLRIHILLELTMGQRERIGLEPWGRIKLIYKGLDEGAPFLQAWARKLKIPADELLGGVAALLDQIRRKKQFHYSLAEIFSKFWAEGSPELENGFLPQLRGVPKGVKLTRVGNDDSQRVDQWLSPGGHQTTASQIAIKWGVADSEVDTFLKELWHYLVGVDVLKQVTLKGSRNKALPNCHGTHQVNGDLIEIAANTSGAYRCRTCRRQTVHRTPHMKCLAWSCKGELEHVPEAPDNYDLQLVDGDYTLLRPREHTAMVPAGERERLENIFKGDTDLINALVCTQTLELGVDIGALDAVLMRNVPPLAANYWQRVGRAGRRHRMAVNLTYCRLVNHDRAYFGEPLKMLGGHVEPPSFNLSNGFMVAKHVHSAVLTKLHQLGRKSSGLPKADQEEIESTLKHVLPATVRDYLFDDAGNVRPAPLDVSGLHTLITKHQSHLEQAVSAAFTQGWPSEDALVVTATKLTQHLVDMTAELEHVLRRLHRRLMWATRQMGQLEVLRQRQGVLNEEQEAFYRRCHRFVNRLKGGRKKKKSEAEGVDDINTYGVLGFEGFLPGYGLEIGAVVGYAEVPKWVRGLYDFDLPRPPAVALREYVPGNLIYANGQRFVPRLYMHDVQEDRETLELEVNLQRQSVQQVQGTSTGDNTALRLKSIPICDVNLLHQSRISDEEENRFQLAVYLFGRELGQHNGGCIYRWGGRPLLHRKGVRLQIVNVGAPLVLSNRNHLGYPVCTVCGQSVSPFSSDRQRDDFITNHSQWCGVAPGMIGFHADLAVDVLSVPGCKDRTEAFSVVEGLRFAATEILNMDTDDLQIMVIGHPDRDECDALLYDPMPGGSGLLEQLCVHFPEVVQLAETLAENCPGRCVASCIDCFQVYRNAAYHKYLDRHVMADRFGEWGTVLEKDHDIPPKQPTPEPMPDARPVNEAERKLKGMLQAAGFPEGQWQLQHPLPHPLGSTTPDVTFDDPSDDTHQVFIYLDGLSEHIHGNPETRLRDQQIRNELRSKCHDVIEISAHDLGDQQAMTRHFKRLARLLVGQDAINRVVAEADQWFKGARM